MKHFILLIILTLTFVTVQAQKTDTIKRQTLNEVQVKSTATGVSRLGGAENGTIMGQEELFRAACCNLGESFVANPSVDVNYSDAAVGAKQIKLLGLSGQYVQMLIEGLPCFSGASVKSGFQSITGQIDVEYIKPDNEQGIDLNLYTDSRLKTEGNAVARLHLNKYLSTELLLHG